MHKKYENQYFIFDNPEPINWKYPVKYVLSVIMQPVYKLIMNIAGCKKSKQKKYKVAICAIFKNEAAYLKEWIEFHKIVGVEHFYLYNNFSDDNYEKILQPYIDNKEITLVEWPYPQGQMAAYYDCIEKYKNETQWLGFIDIDEFVIPKKVNTIYDFLKHFSHRPAVLMYWKIYGSSGFFKRSKTRLVTEDFVVSWPKHVNIGKCFYNTNYDFAKGAKKNKVMHHLLYTKFRKILLPPVNVFGYNILFNRHLGIRCDFPIQINHYYTKSLEEYQEKKKRKSVYHAHNTHTDNAFFEHEMKCTSVDYSAYRFLIKLKKAIRR